MQRIDIVAILEPRISVLKADRFIQRAGFDCSFRVEAHGLSGGIWILWQSSIHLEVLVVSSQYVHARCTIPTVVSCFYGLFVYASPQNSKRRELWEQFLAIAPDDDTPWVVGGDSNVISSVDERVGFECLC
ncbi:hypothetical protein V6N13_142601 [Hibiscus sabdariffa]